jgi:hypothetical protein
MINPLEVCLLIRDILIYLEHVTMRPFSRLLCLRFGLSETETALYICIETELH